MRLDQESIGKISAFIAEHVTKSPVIIQESHNRVRVNDVIVEDKDGSWTVQKRSNKLGSFTYKSWALAYAVGYVTGNAPVVRYLDDREQTLSRLKIDKDLYNHHLKQALKRGDDINIDVIEGRLSRTEGEIFELLDEAQQVLLYQRIG